MSMNQDEFDFESLIDDVARSVFDDMDIMEWVEKKREEAENEYIRMAEDEAEEAGSDVFLEGEEFGVGIQEWCEQNAEDSFQNFVDEHVDFHEYIHRAVDSYFPNSLDKAVHIIQTSKYDSTDVDPGIYEGLTWEKMTICIAAYMLEQEVLDRIEEMFADQDFSSNQLIRMFPTHYTQIGSYPNHRIYKVAVKKDTQENDYLFSQAEDNLGWVKLLLKGKKGSPGALSKHTPTLVFEGKTIRVDEDRHEYNSVVCVCRRIYTQNVDVDKKVDDMSVQGLFRYALSQDDIEISAVRKPDTDLRVKLGIE